MEKSYKTNMLIQREGHLWYPGNCMSIAQSGLCQEWGAFRSVMGIHQDFFLKDLTKVSSQSIGMYFVHQKNQQL